MDKAAFSLDNYRFEKANIDFTKKISNNIEMEIKPSGKFIAEKSVYELKFYFYAFNKDIKNSFVIIECIALFRFENKLNFENIPSYFYRNSIAIIFPYIRAFISTITLQTNTPPIILPTMNLSSLESLLKENTTQI